MTERDKAIRDTLTSQPQWIEEWDEYAATADDGALYTSETYRQCEALVQEANAVIAAHKRRAADAVTESLELTIQATRAVRESLEAWLAEIKENQK